MSHAMSKCPMHRATSAPTLPAIDYFDPVFKADAHAIYATLREHAPVHRTVFRDGRPLWLVSRHDDVLAILKDPRFVKDRSATLTPEENAALPKWPDALRYVLRMLTNIDPPLHTRQRRLVMQAFSPRLVESLRPRIQAIADRLLERPLARGSMELMAEFAFPLPITVIAELLGLPVADQPLFRQWSNVLVTHVGVRDAAAMRFLIPVIEAMAAYLRQLFEAKRRAPADDLISHLLKVSEGGDTLTEEEIISHILLLIVAGHETTAHLIGNGMLALLRHPEQMARLARMPEMLPRAIEELLRYDGPAETSTLRFPREDVTVCGVTIPRGELVMVVLTSANRDEERRANADCLDIEREDNAHLAFGHGIHFCIGAALARLEGELAIGTLLRRLRNVQIAIPESKLRWRLGPLARGLEVLPLEFECDPVQAAPAGALQRAPVALAR